MRPARALTALAAVFTLTACGGTVDDPVPSTQELRADGVQRVAAPTDAPVGDAVSGLVTFTDRLGEAIAEDGQNTVFSPLSVASAFAMLRAGADGQTAEQLDATFGFPEGVHPAYNALTTGFTADGQPTVRLANGLFVQQGTKLGDEFLHTLAEQYGAGAHAADFSGSGGVEQVNAWVSEQTEGKIPQLLDGLSPQTKFVLANAVYFKAEWENKFPAHKTSENGEFQLANGEHVRAPMMSRDSDLAYVDGDGWSAAALPYAGGEFAMWVVVPDELSAQPRITADMLDGFASAQQRKVVLTMPRWDFSTKVDLGEQLSALGLNSLGDLDPIAPNVAVDTAVHEATITVGEEGTEAAAATALGGAGAAPMEEQPVPLRADRPFAFAITHLESGAPLFAGTVADPSR